MERKTNIDLVRIFSATLVLAIHISQYVGSEYSVGKTGVLCFFVMSGFLSFLSMEKIQDASEFYKNRIIRILPCYYISLTIIYFKDLIWNTIRSNSVMNAFHNVCSARFLRYFTFVQLIIPSDDWELWNNRSALWTMSSFMVFYLLTPILFKVINNYMKALITLIFFLFLTPLFNKLLYIMLTKLEWVSHPEWFARLNPISELYVFLFGVLVYYTVKEKRHGFTSLVLLMLLVVSDFAYYKYEIVFSMLILLAYSYPDMISNSEARKILREVADGSFLLYLLHPTVLFIVSTVWTSVFHFEGSGFFYVFSLTITVFLSAYSIYFLVVKRIELLVKNLM